MLNTTYFEQCCWCEKITDDWIEYGNKIYCSMECVDEECYHLLENTWESD